MKMNFVALFVILGASTHLAHCQGETDGRLAAEGQFPYEVAINGSRFCAGSLISEDYVLTSVTCLIDGNIRVSSVEIILGVTSGVDCTRSGQLRLRSSNITIHENYKTFTDYNIALIKLPYSVEFTSTIQTVNLPDLNENSTFEDETAFFTGWGIFSNNLTPTRKDLRYLKAATITNSACRALNPTYDSFVTEKHICFPNQNNKATCVMRDLGSPLVINGVQVGIFAYGFTDCGVDEPGVFTRVTAFREWIRQHSKV